MITETLITVHVRLIDAARGVDHTIVEQMPESELTSYAFLWDEGNFACDCNRSLMLARYVLGYVPIRECGDTRVELESITRADTGESLL